MIESKHEGNQGPARRTRFQTIRHCPSGKARTECFQNVLCSLWCEGMSFKQMAGLLKLSGKTIECHWLNFRKRIGIWHEAGIVKWAIKEGITTL